MKAVILAAGVGKRLGAITREIPKPMAPVAGKPVLEHILCGLRDSGIDDFVLITKYKWEKIRDHFREGADLGISIVYVVQGERYGTGAALLEAERHVDGEPLLMTYGDIVTSPDNYAGVMRLFGKGCADAVVTLNWVDDPHKGGAVVVGDDDRVLRIIEKPSEGEIPSRWNNAGLFVFRPSVFGFLREVKPSPRGEYELPDAINAMIDAGLAARPYFLKGPWRDVGTPEDLVAAERILSKEQLD
jgi:UDP-N-acetylglucosamine diphosphorylase / glucose-1-phosphate thymidylyltransferase / UDP-N-acetylgalactosamine diphosphorylase / glucosamine-1-phosphate N-acetyltransferase / galactosamine-1-phosphate N-acetyltransferase